MKIEPRKPGRGRSLPATSAAGVPPALGSACQFAGTMRQALVISQAGRARPIFANECSPRGPTTPGRYRHYTYSARQGSDWKGEVWNQPLGRLRGRKMATKTMGWPTRSADPNATSSLKRNAGQETHSPRFRSYAGLAIIRQANWGRRNGRGHPLERSRQNPISANALTRPETLVERCFNEVSNPRRGRAQRAEAHTCRMRFDADHLASFIEVTTSRTLPPSAGC